MKTYSPNILATIWRYMTSSIHSAFHSQKRNKQQFEHMADDIFERILL